MQIKPKNITVVGGNAAGPAAAARAKKVNPGAEVLLFESGDFISTGTCELPYVLSGEISDYKNIVFFDADTFRQQKGVEVKVKHRVDSINRRVKEITVYDIQNKKYVTAGYDSLILATGSVVHNPGFLPQNATNIFSLKNVNDLVKIQNYIRNNNLQRVLVTGAGFIGLEISEAFRKIGMDVIIVDKNKSPMGETSDEIQQLFLSLLDKNKIDFYGDNPKIVFNQKDNIIKSVKINSLVYEIDLVINCTGVKANTDLALSVGIESGKSGGIKTDFKQKTNISDIYACGDNCEVVNFITNRPIYLPQATAAYNTGHIAGENAAGGNVSGKAFIKNTALNLFGNTFVSVGLNPAEAKSFRNSIKTVTATAQNIIKVMPGAGSIFGNIFYDSNNEIILGAEFFGKGEVTGYGNIISMMIRNRTKISELASGDFNYHPPVSPFINILNILGKKIKGDK